MFEKSPVSPRWWPVAIAEPLAVVKVGNSEWLLARFTPWSRSAAMAGAVSGVTIPARIPSGTNRITLRGRAAAAAAVPSRPATMTPLRIARIAVVS